MRKKIVLSLAAIMTVSSLNAMDTEFLKNLKTDVSDTVRFTSDNNIPNNLDTTTNKLKLNVTGQIDFLPQTSFEIEVTDIRNLNDEVGSKTLNGEKQTKLNRLNLTTDISQIDTVVKLGRQAVTLDKGSLISNNPWNLMETSVDRVSVVNNSIKNLTLLGAYGWQVNPADTKENLKDSFVLLNAKYSILDGVSISVYDYLIEDTRDTYGALFDVNVEDSGLSYLLTAEYNKQKNPNIGKTNVDVDGKFYNVSAGLGALDTEMRVGYTVSKDNFVAPLGDSHNFLGTSDMVGHGDVKSTYVTLNSKLTNKLTAEASYHYLKRESDGVKLGNELDLGLGYKIHKNVDVLAKTAIFNAYGQSGLADDRKVWLELKVSF